MTVIDEYLSSVPEPQKSALQRVRKIAMEVVPDAEDTIGYGMPVLRYKDKYMIGFAPFKDHMSIFPGSDPLTHLETELKQFKRSKGTIQFTINNPIPEKLLREIVDNCKNRILNK